MLQALFSGYAGGTDNWRAVLLHKGRIAGDVQTAELDEQGKTLMDYVKETYSYQSDRVSRALTDLTGKEDEHA